MLKIASTSVIVIFVLCDTCELMNRNTNFENEFEPAFDSLQWG